MAFLTRVYMEGDMMTRTVSSVLMALFAALVTVPQPARSEIHDPAFLAALDENTELSEEQRKQRRDEIGRDMIGNARTVLLGVSNLMGIPLRQAEKYIIKPTLWAIGEAANGNGDMLRNKWDNMFGYGDQPQNHYATIRSALEQGDADKARKFTEIVLEMGGSAGKFLGAKSGGAELPRELKQQFIDIWRTAEKKYDVDSVRLGLTEEE